MDYKVYWQLAISYPEYLENFDRELRDGSSKPYSEKLPINRQRNSRILKTFHLPDAALQKISALMAPLKWVVISEHWCGDSAQIIPVMHKIAEASNGKIELRLIYRDDYPEFMDAHLTNGGKSIPKLIQLNEIFEVTGMYGPRPAFAMDLVKTMKSDPKTAPFYSEELHKWYAHDKQQSILEDLLKLF